MALTIKEKNGTYFAEGSLNASTAKNFKTHLEFIMNSYEILTINLDNIEDIDNNGLDAIRGLYFNALINNKDFFIVGDKCDKFYENVSYAHFA